ncbi:hypothetical protein VTP01DRAFT_2281 [Rhizomucor pusillus]|uniref:uncharacterized protein n=1 Tax=Rhizomucor pusillus TaxID=4840 RepID=UPI0037429E56
MARSYIHRLTSLSQIAHLGSTKSLLAPPLAYLRPTFNAHRLLTFTSQSQPHSSSPPASSTSFLDASTATATAAAAAVNHTPAFSPGSYLKAHADAQVLKKKTSTASIPESVQHAEEKPPAPVDCFQFVAHAAWHPKNRHPRQRQSQDKVPYWKRSKVGNVDAGEDAFFHTYTPYGMALGVADGVGGWADAGVDPAIFSWTLMNNAAGIAKKSEQQPPIDALQILDSAFHQLCRSGKVAAGSSTACILNLCKTTGQMTSVNLGDSAFLLIRDKKIVYESPSQQHYFNCPYQLTVVPDTYPDRDSFVTDMPKDADRKTFFLKNNDIIVLATDGYFDNVFHHDTLSTVNENMRHILEPTMEVSDEEVAAAVRNLAKTLTDNARRWSLDPKRDSPWAKDAQAHGSNYRGGKVDDITCIVTLVRDIQRQQQQ